jgi:histidinol-phosphate phosphatase family protein
MITKEHNMTLPNADQLQNWTLFLDRDGVINRRIVGGYVQTWDQFEFLEGVKEAIRNMTGVFGRVVVVTNQQGVGKGLMSLEDLELIHQKMTTAIQAAGGRIDAVLACPDLEHQQPNGRKPSPHLALQARARFPEIDFARSIMVGDSPSDMAFGANLGMYTVFVDGGDPNARVGQAGCHLRLASLKAFAEKML